MSEHIDSPSIVIDFSKYRIRIHKKTIAQMGSPNYILLIINPQQLALCIVGCTKSIKGSHKIILDKSHCYELYSKSLVSKLEEVFNCWDNDKSYKIIGKFFEKEKIAKFIVTDSFPVTLF